MILNYYLVGTGWASLIIEIDDLKLKYDVSYIGGDLSNLLHSIVNMLGIDPNEPDDPEGFLWKINQEGNSVEFDIDITDNKEIINLKITEIYEEEKNCVFNGRINTNEFVNNVINSCDKILSRYGIIGYYRNWMMGGFPITYYLILKNYQKTNKRFKINWIEGEKDPDFIYSDMAQTSLNSELNILKDICKKPIK